MTQLMPLPLTVTCFSKIQTGFASLVPAYLGSPGKRAVKRVCVCVCVKESMNNEHLNTDIQFCNNCVILIQLVHVKFHLKQCIRIYRFYFKFHTFL